MFLESLYGYLMTAGNAYIEAVMLEGKVRELHTLRPDRMKVIAGADGWAEGYEYAVGRDAVRFMQTDSTVPPILHLTLFHPLDDHYGMAPIEAAASALDVHNAASEWNKALLDNAARPSGALVFTGDTSGLTDDQFQRLKTELEDEYQGARNAGKPLLLEGGLDWKTMALTPRDMDFIEAKNGAAREIALAFGVPPMLLGIPGDNTYANYAEANRAFYRLTVLPLVNRTAASLSQWLSPAFGAEMRLGVDLDQIEALSSEREALWSRIGAASFLTDDEKRMAVGYGGDPIKDGNKNQLKANFDPAQPRDDQGRWTDTGASAGGGRRPDDTERIELVQNTPPPTERTRAKQRNVHPRGATRSCNIDCKSCHAAGARARPKLAPTRRGVFND